MQALHKFWTNMPEYGWIMPEKTVLWQGSEYAWSKFYRLLNVRPVLNMTELEDCEYVKVTQDAEYALAMPQYAWICLNNSEYV